METRRKPGPRAAWVLLAALIVASATAAPAAAMESHGALSPLLEQLARPAVRSLPPAQQAEAVGVAATGPGSLLREDGRVLTEVRFEQGAIARRDELHSAGGKVLGASRHLQSVTVAAPPGDLHAVAAVPDVAAVTPILAPVTYAVNCKGGSVISEGVGQLHAAETAAYPVEGAREKFSVDGEGVTVGILSDSFNKATGAATSAAKDEETADLPGPAVPGSGECAGEESSVKNLEDLGSTGSDEGRGMLQIVHDVAPKASLAFATAFKGETSFAQNIEKLAKPVGEGGAGAAVIADDVGYFEEPFFQNGPIAAAVEKVVGEGVSYLSSAGNDNLFDGEGNEIASWEAPAFRDSGGCPPAISSLSELNGTHCMDFNPGPETDRAFGIKVEAGETLLLDLQWAEPWYGVGTDLDAFLLNETGGLLAKSVDDNPMTGRPVEILQWTNSSSAVKTVQLAVNRYSGGDPRLKFILLQNGGGVSGTEYPRSGGGDVVGPSIYGHAGAAGAIATAAIRYNTTSQPEYFSSRGPSTLYYGPVSGTTPAAALAEPEVISKPDVTATDCGATTFFASFFSGAWRFCGTSAAAPHAAGVMALMKQAEPAASAGELRTALLGTGSAVGAFGPCAIGGGIVEALTATAAVKGEATPVTPTACAAPDASGPVFVAAGFWGSEEPVEPEPEPEPQPEPEPEPEPTPENAPVPTESQGTVTAVPAAPTTRFVTHPQKLVRTRSRTARVVFRFGSDQAGVAYLCRFDGRAYRRCSNRVARRLGLGRHVVRVKARNSAGAVDASPAVFRFRVKRVLPHRIHSAHRHLRSATR